jgi:hypothetical protein
MILNDISNQQILTILFKLVLEFLLDPTTRKITKIIRNLPPPHEITLIIKIVNKTNQVPVSPRQPAIPKH